MSDEKPAQRFELSKEQLEEQDYYMDHCGPRSGDYGASCTTAMLKIVGWVGGGGLLLMILYALGERYWWGS